MTEEMDKKERSPETAPAAAEGAAAKVPAMPKKSRKKRGITIGVIAAVVVVAAIGFFIWHEQPSFCNAICHTPMDGYLDTYEAVPGQPALDKYGDQVADAAGMLAATHREEGATCMGCHVPTLGEQIGEGIGWVSGNYETVLPDDVFGPRLMERDLAQLTAARGIPSEEFCLNENCHNLTREQLEEQTAGIEFNPHSLHHGEVDCGTCHKAHRASIDYCTQCHMDAPVPEGWLSWGEAQAQGLL